MEPNGFGWFKLVMQRYAVFDGRARRKEYWFFILFYFIIAIGLSLIDGAMGTYNSKANLGLLSGLWALATLLPWAGVSIRRLHDTGRSGWWLLLILVPFVGPLVLLVFEVLDSEPGTNAYGPNPKAVLLG